MNRVWSFYRLDDGFFTGQTYSGLDVELNTPAGCGAFPGRHDHLSRRVDLETVQVVDYVPPPPDAEHEWNAKLRRYVRTEAAARRVARAEATSRRTEELERAQARAIRELALNPSDAVSRQRLLEIEREIAELHEREPRG